MFYHLAIVWWSLFCRLRVNFKWNFGGFGLALRRWKLVCFAPSRYDHMQFLSVNGSDFGLIWNVTFRFRSNSVLMDVILSCSDRVTVFRNIFVWFRLGWLQREFLGSCQVACRQKLFYFAWIEMMFFKYFFFESCFGSTSLK